MKTTVQKWGNSLALRIPKAYADETDIREGSSVELSLGSGCLTITPTRKDAITLDGLLKGVTAKNCHMAVETGSPTGQEVW